MKVLVIEDDSAVRETLGMVLEAFQHLPVLASNGDEALVQLEADWPDVILLDLTLEGVTGEEVYQNIVNRFGRIPPTIVLTAVPQGQNRQRYMPGTWFLAKPYTIEDLAEVLDEAVASSRGAA